MPRILYTFFSFILLAVLFSACKQEIDPEDLKIRILGEVNALRTSGCNCGEDTMPPVPEVVWSDELEVAAERHLNDMLENNFFQHTGSDQSTPLGRAKEASFTGTYIGENIARGYIFINDVMNEWTNSPAHCKTMMDEKFRYMAVAYEEFYWVQVFGNE